MMVTLSFLNGMRGKASPLNFGNMDSLSLKATPFKIFTSDLY